MCSNIYELINLQTEIRCSFFLKGLYLPGKDLPGISTGQLDCGSAQSNFRERRGGVGAATRLILGASVLNSAVR